MGKWLTWIGLAVIVGAVVIGVWQQFTIPDYGPVGRQLAYLRLQAADNALSAVAFGVIAAALGRLISLFEARYAGTSPSSN